MPERISSTGESPHDRPGGQFLDRVNGLLRLLPGGLQINRGASEVNYSTVVDQPAAEEPSGQESPTEESDDQRVVVVHVQPLGRFEFVNRQGREVYPPTTHHNPRTALKLFDHLAAIYIPNGIGEYPISRVATILGYTVVGARSEIVQIGKLLPNKLFDSEQLPGGSLRLTLGNMALASRRATEEDAARIDKGKVDLITADHALITIGENRFYMPLETDEAILAARVIDALRNNGGRGVQLADITKAVWRGMTIGERRLFVSEPMDAFNNEGRIQEAVLGILRRLTNQLLITHERTDERFDVMSDRLRIGFSNNVLDVQKFSSARPVLPPGQEIVITPAPDDLAMAQRTLEVLDTEGSLDQYEAIEILHFVTTVVGKRALAEVLKAQGKEATYVVTMIAIRTMIELKLRSGYDDALTKRTVAGGRILGITLVSGQLPITTKWSLGRPVGEDSRR
ncbi:MAG TPA: hypothetical protein VMB52_03195 [Verrucomicrobiae bacterium]|nr:hypothetical protein [Verrucomicrobiae bacterium]